MSACHVIESIHGWLEAEVLRLQLSVSVRAEEPLSSEDCYFHLATALDRVSWVLYRYMRETKRLLPIFTRTSYV